jgi:hypothetical protein
MIKKFDEFNSKFKFLFNLDTDTQVARELNIENTSYATMKRHDQIPYDRVIEYCKEKSIDLNWILNIKKNS